MNAPERYDAIIVGAGQGGGPLSGALARAGRHTALIERAEVGGTCINVGCTPTKTMVASARAAYLARRGADYGVLTGPIQVDMATVRRRKRQIVETFRSGSEHHVLTTPNLELIRGDAHFVAEKTLEISLQAGGTRLLAADLVVIDTGQRPAVLPVPGLAELQPLDSTSVMELASVPDHLVVLGGGYVGIEFGQMFRRFGSAVTMIEMAPRILGKEDEDIAAAVTDILREDGIEILTGSEVTSAERNASGLPLLNLQTPDGTRTLTASHILAAAGRTPNTDGLNLAATGVRTSERGFVPVDERLETNVPGVYAVGDVNGGPAFTHISYDDYRILKTNLLEGGDRKTVDRLLAYTVFMDPELGRIGLSEQEARRQGRSIRIASMPMSHVARALEVDESRGLMKVVIDAATDQVLGASILGIEGGELMSMLQIAMIGGVTTAQLRDAVFAHPTLAESLNNLFG